jgi:hypothetical protein
MLRVSCFVFWVSGRLEAWEFDLVKAKSSEKVGGFWHSGFGIGFRVKVSDFRSRSFGYRGEGLQDIGLRVKGLAIARYRVSC